MTDPVMRVHASLTDRDHVLLGWLADHGVLTSFQIAGALFPSRDYAQERLHRLTRLGVLDRFRPFFTTRYGTPIEPRNFNRFWDRRCTSAEARRITAHDARRTCGSLLADLDVHPRTAMPILRHAQFSITMELYTQVSPKATRDALKRLGKVLGQ